MRVAVAPIVVEGDGTEQRVDPERARTELTDRIANALRSEFSLVSVEGCDETEQLCSLAQAREAGAHYVVDLSWVAEGADDRVRFAIRNTETGTVEVTFEDVCELCGQTELDAFLAATVGALTTKLRTLEPDPSQVSIVGAPSNATIWIDDRRVGAIPWQGELEPGEHHVKVERSGYLTRHKRIELVAGTHERVQVDLDRDPRGTSRALKIAGWTLVGTGAAAVGGGAALWAMDGRPHRGSCVQQDAEGRCPNMYSSRPGGIALTVTGLSALVVGGGLLVYEHVRFNRTRWRAAVQPGIRRATVQVWF